MPSDHITDAMVEEALNAFTGGMLADFARDDAPFLGMRAALLAAERAAWKDIETAPRDGTPVLATGGEKWIAGKVRWDNSAADTYGLFIGRLYIGEAYMSSGGEWRAHHADAALGSVQVSGHWDTGAEARAALLAAVRAAMEAPHDQ